MKRLYTLRSGSAGFSLIELMVVIAIASILTAILVSSFSKEDTREAEVYNAAREFGTFVQKYRMQGINENVCYIFSFTSGTGAPTGNLYQIYKNNGFDADGNAAGSNCDGLTASGTLQKTVNLSSYKYNVMFGSFGDSACTSEGVGISGACPTNAGDTASFYFKPRGFLNVTVDVSIYFTTKDDYDLGNKNVQVRTRVDSLTGRVDLEKYAQEPW